MIHTRAQKCKTERSISHLPARSVVVVALDGATHQKERVREANTNASVCVVVYKRDWLMDVNATQYVKTIEIFVVVLFFPPFL